MGAVQGATITLGEAARSFDTTIDALLELIYEGRLQATADPSTGRLRVKRADLEQLSQA